MCTTTPESNTFVSASVSTVFSRVSGKSRLPLPSTTGKIISRYSSTRSCSIREVHEGPAAGDEEVPRSA